jgi:hypothetical protein
MAYRFMKEYQNEYTTGEMARLFEVSYSAYYRRAKYGVSKQRKEGGAELEGLRQAEKGQESGRFGVEKRVEHPGKAEVHLHNQLDPRISGLRQRVEL